MFFIIFQNPTFGHCLDPSWIHVGSTWPKLAPSWLNLAPSWLQVGSSWFQVGSKLAQDSSSWLQVGTKLGPSWLHVGPRWSKLAPSWPKLAHLGSKFGFIEGQGRSKNGSRRDHGAFRSPGWLQGWPWKPKVASSRASQHTPQVSKKCPQN